MVLRQISPKSMVLDMGNGFVHVKKVGMVSNVTDRRIYNALRFEQSLRMLLCNFRLACFSRLVYFVIYEYGTFVCDDWKKFAKFSSTNTEFVKPLSR